MESEKQGKVVFGTNYTLPNKGRTWDNFFIDKKNQNAFIQKFQLFIAKKDLREGKISDAEYKNLRKNFFGKTKI